MKYAAITALVIVGVIRQSVVAQPKIVRVDTLTLDRAIALALENHPSLQAADANARSAAAGVTQAVSAYYPSLSANANFNRTDGVFVFNPSIQPKSQTYNNYSSGFQFQQNIIDYGRMVKRVSASQGLFDASMADYESTREDVVMNTEIAYFSLIQSDQVVKVNEEGVAQAEQHLREAKANYTVGKRPQSDVTKAEVDLANANVEFIHARNQVQLARVGMENAMGVRPRGEYHIQRDFDVPPQSMPLDSIESIGLRQRPDLVSARARVDADNALVAAAWDQNLPTVSLTSAWNWSNFDYTPLFRRWTAGLTVTLPLFQGFSIGAQVDQARATADGARATLEVMVEAAMLDMEQNYLSLKEADERIVASTKLVEQAEENLTLAERQYAAGVGTEIEVTDARLSLSNARITKIQALFDYNSSFVRLQRSIGTLNR